MGPTTVAVSWFRLRELQKNIQILHLRKDLGADGQTNVHVPNITTDSEQCTFSNRFMTIPNMMKQPWNKETTAYQFWFNFGAHMTSLSSQFVRAPQLWSQCGSLILVCNDGLRTRETQGDDRVCNLGKRFQHPLKCSAENILLSRTCSVSLQNCKVILKNEKLFKLKSIYF